MPGIKTRKLSGRNRWVILGGLILAIAGWLPTAAVAQDAAAPAAKPVTFLGTVQTLSGNTLTVKSDAGATMQVTVEENARLLRIEPGQKTLTGASPFSLADLQAGDRVMARGSANADGSSLAATMLVAIKGADIAQKQQQDREDLLNEDHVKREELDGLRGMVEKLSTEMAIIDNELTQSGYRGISIAQR